MRMAQRAQKDADVTSYRSLSVWIGSTVTSRSCSMLATAAFRPSWKRLSGKGVPDLLVGIRGLNILLECKAPVGPRGGLNGRDLTDDQRIWHATWRGSKPWVVRSAEDAIAAVRAASADPR